MRTANIVRVIKTSAGTKTKWLWQDTIRYNFGIKKMFPRI